MVMVFVGALVLATGALLDSRRLLSAGADFGLVAAAASFAYALDVSSGMVIPLVTLGVFFLGAASAAGFARPPPERVAT